MKTILNHNMMFSTQKHNIGNMIIDWISINMVSFRFFTIANFTRFKFVNFFSPISTSLFRYFIAFPKRTIFSFWHNSTFFRTKFFSPAYIKFFAIITIPFVFNIFARGVCIISLYYNWIIHIINNSISPIKHKYGNL